MVAKVEITPEIKKLQETVALAHRIMFITGLTTASGHASARIPGRDQFVIKPWPHKHMNRHTADEMIVVDLDGNRLTGPDTITVVSEWYIHAELYRARPDVNGVVHTHQKWATMMGIAGKTILPVLHPDFAAVAADTVFTRLGEDQQPAALHAAGGEPTKASGNLASRATPSERLDRRTLRRTAIARRITASAVDLALTSDEPIRRRARRE